jgi:uncharacterized membrane protein
MPPGNRLRRTLWTAVIFLAFIGIAVATRRITHVLPIALHGYRPPSPPANPVAAQFAGVDDIFARYPYLTLFHIVPGILFMILGPLQFNASLRANYPQGHRISGRVFLICAAMIGISALVMSFAMPAIGGVTQAAATTLFGSFFLFALGKAFWHIRHREIALHRRWMIRAFSTGLAVATIRPIVGVFVALTIAMRGTASVNPHAIFGPAFWLGFTIHLVAAEAWIRTTPFSPEPLLVGAQHAAPQVRTV